MIGKGRGCVLPALFLSRKMNNTFLSTRLTAGARVTPVENGWRLSIPPGAAGAYRWAQLDDYMDLPRKAFRHAAPLALSLRARVSAQCLPGTWGFGLWNDPFSMGLGVGGARRRLPALPQTAWFFHASDDNYLSLRDDLPANGMLMGVFQSARLPAWSLLPAAPLLAGLALPPLARLLRRAARWLVKEESARLELDFTGWHEYRLEWRAEGVRFAVDGETRFETRLSPRGRMGLVLWVDNQFAAFRPDGQVRFGTKANPLEAWLEITDVEW